VVGEDEELRLQKRKHPEKYDTDPAITQYQQLYALGPLRLAAGPRAGGLRNRIDSYENRWRNLDNMYTDAGRRKKTKSR